MVSVPGLGCARRKAAPCRAAFCLVVIPHTQKGIPIVGTNLYDGSDDPLAYGQALVILAQRPGLFANESEQRAVVAAIQGEHGLTPPEPDAVANPSDPRDVTLREQDAELDRLRAELARRDKADQESQAKADEIASLKAQLSE